MSSSATSLPSAPANPPLSFGDGFRDIMPVMVATVPFGMIFGALATREGMSLGESLLMSGLVYAGASQFIALEFWAHPLPFWTILLSVLAVNLRHVLYSAALGRKMTHWAPGARYAGFALLVDPTFAIAELKGGQRLSVAYYFGLSIPLYVNWMATTAIGAVFGSLIRHPEAFGFDFVVTAYFIYLVVSFRARPHALAIVLTSAAGAMLAFFAFGSPWHIGVGAVAGMAAAAVLARPRRAPA